MFSMRLEQRDKRLWPTKRNIHAGQLSRPDGIDYVVIGVADRHKVNDEAPILVAKHGQASIFRICCKIYATPSHDLTVVHLTLVTARGSTHITFFHEQSHSSTPRDFAVFAPNEDLQSTQEVNGLFMKAPKP